ncbi:MAG TPA: phage tail protein [Bryobacteraceae bacterium]|jgi:phage tail-like protein|nr:phage tail protein [Bryobacteraceae bacterium]
MATRIAPLPSYQFLVDLGSGSADPASPLGGFSDVSGLETDIHISEYRNGNEPDPHVRKIPGSHKVGDVTLKRGVVNSMDLWAWMQAARTTGVAAQRDVVITLCDESGAPMQKWKLRNVVPMKYTGPTLAGKGGGEVAMEELVLSAEGYEISSANS